MTAAQRAFLTASRMSAVKASSREGVIAINKPMGMSSAQVIRDCQEQFNPSAFFRPLIESEQTKRARESQFQQRRRRHVKQDLRVKMGHGGTLDPLATGVLILGLGSGTKALPQFLDCTKTYETVVLFGASTDTYDRVGRILQKRPYEEITRERVEEALGSFRGKFKQMPPLYSALKMNGKPLYEYAREGKEIPREIATRDVEVTELEMVEWMEPGTHNHRWPADEAAPVEQAVASQLWRREREQTENGGKTSTPEEAEEDERARKAHESFKRDAETRQDGLVVEHASKRQRVNENNGNGKTKKKGKGGAEGMMMSGALGELPESTNSNKGSNLIPPPPSKDTPPPWEGVGPAAVRIRMTVTSGFYVRSFCHDLGQKLGSAAMMAELSRTRQSDFVVGTSKCLDYDDLAKGEEVWAPKVEAMLSEWQAAHPSPAANHHSNGNGNNNNNNNNNNNGFGRKGGKPDYQQHHKRNSSSGSSFQNNGSVQGHNSGHSRTNSATDENPLKRANPSSPEVSSETDAKKQKTDP